MLLNALSWVADSDPQVMSVEADYDRCPSELHYSKDGHRRTTVETEPHSSAKNYSQSVDQSPRPSLGRQDALTSTPGFDSHAVPNQPNKAKLD
jgi:hypothetical protein